MEAQFVNIPDFQFSSVWFYTMHYTGRKFNEFEYFMQKWGKKLVNVGKDEKLLLLREDLQVIDRLIRKIGKNGLSKGLYKNEADAKGSNAIALPHFYRHREGKNNGYGLRLYAIKLSDSIVILLNGNEKTTQRAIDSPFTKDYFKEANKLSIALNKEIENKQIVINGKKIIISKDYKLNF